MSVFANFANASFGNSCSTFLNKLVGLVGIEIYITPEMNSQEKIGFEKIKAFDFSKIDHISFLNYRTNEGKYLLSLLSLEARAYLAQYPSGRNNIISFKQNLKTRIGFNEDSIIENYFSIIDSIIKNDPLNLDKKLSDLVQEYEDLKISEKSATEHKFKKQQLLTKAKNNWLSLGKIKISEFSFGENFIVEINGEKYDAKRIVSNGKSQVVLTVPVHQVKHPAWNPLNHQYIAQLASNPLRIEKSQYDVVLGHDGYFYLMDGNHRFSLYSKPMVKVILPSPISTESLRVFFDLKNIPQPTTEQIIQIYNGELNPYDLIPHHLRNEIVFEI